MTTRFAALLALSLALTLAVVGCGGDPAKKVVGPGGDPTAELNAAFTALQNNNLSQANLHFKNAISVDPNNGQANLGAAVTEIAILSDDPEVAELLDLLDAASTEIPIAGSVPLRSPRAPLFRQSVPESPRAAAMRHVGLPSSSRFNVLTSGQRLFGFLMKSAIDPGPISRLQQIVRNKVLPKLAYVEARLNVVEALPGFTMLLPTAVTGLSYELEIDTGDVLVLDAVVNLVQGTAEILVSYNADVPSYQSVNVESLLTTPGSEFATLYPDGEMQLSNARLDWLAAVATMDQGVTSILAEVDPQDNDLILAEVFGTPGEIADLRYQLARLDDALNGPVYVQFVNWYGQADSVQIDASAFFTSPIQDLKEFLPDHTFDVAHEFVTDVPLNFPQPTFNGILPGMTNDRIRYLLGIVQVAVAGP